MKQVKQICAGVLSVAAICTVFITSCKKDKPGNSGTTPPGKQTVSVYLNDDADPAYASVLVNISYVEVKVDTATTGHDDAYYDDDHEGEPGDTSDHHGDKFGKWDTLSVEPGVYDLVKLRNGTDTLIAKGIADMGKISKIRLTLGTGNKISVDSSGSMDLPICDSNMYAYARVRSNSIDDLSGNEFAIHVDFDLPKSIKNEGGQFCLNPFLRAFAESATGKISGNVQPAEAHATIMVFSDADTAFTTPAADGKFAFSGLTPAAYSVSIKAMTPFADTVINNVTVEEGKEAKLPDIVLHQ
jgi:hypothetical protein